MSLVKVQLLRHEGIKKRMYSVNYKNSLSKAKPPFEIRKLLIDEQIDVLCC